MKVFMCGGGAGEQTVEANQRLNEVIDHTKPLLYIPLAMEEEMYPNCLEWIKGELTQVDIPEIELVTSREELVSKDLKEYCALFLGGGNTYKLLYDLKVSGAFERIREYLEQDGVVFGGSAGAIIFGADLEACALDDDNEVGLTDIAGFDVLNGISILCHYTNRIAEKDAESTEYLLELSKRKKIIALPEEDTIFLNGDSIEVIGTRPYYYFENGNRVRLEPGNLRTKRLSEMTLEDLWQLFPIFLTEHKECWADWYEEEANRLRGILPEHEIAQISHIGSTAIKGIWAKPIIDILLEVPAICDMQAVRGILTKNGYICMSEQDNRFSFNRGYTAQGFAERVFHLHLRYVGDNDEVYFRDYMNGHPELAKQYEALKLELWKQYEHNRDGYTESKTEFVTECTRRAKMHI